MSKGTKKYLKILAGGMTLYIIFRMIFMNSNIIQNFFKFLGLTAGEFITVTFFYSVMVIPILLIISVYNES